MAWKPSSRTCSFWRFMKPADKSSLFVVREPPNATSIVPRSSGRFAFGVAPRGGSDPQWGSASLEGSPEGSEPARRQRLLRQSLPETPSLRVYRKCRTRECSLGCVPHTFQSGDRTNAPLPCTNGTRVGECVCQGHAGCVNANVVLKQPNLEPPWQQT